MGPGRILGTVLLIGAGVAVVAGIAAAPVVLRRARPLVREGLKRGMRFYADARSAAAEFVEDVEDLVAEVKNDLTAEGEAPVAAAAPAGVKEA